MNTQYIKGQIYAVDNYLKISLGDTICHACLSKHFLGTVFFLSHSLFPAIYPTLRHISDMRLNKCRHSMYSMAALDKWKENKIVVNSFVSKTLEQH